MSKALAVEPVGPQHLGGGRKGILLLLRYVYIIAAAYLLVFRAESGWLTTAQALMIATVLASNVVLAFVPPRLLFSWFIEGPVLIADTLWVAWALHSAQTTGQELFLLYFFVLFLAAVGETPVLVVLSSTLLSAVEIYLMARGPVFQAGNLLQICFFYSVALFFGYVIGEIKRERKRADKGLAWAKKLEVEVAARTAELSRLYEASITANGLKTEFLASMSHELRTPLHIIVGYAQILRDDERIEAAERQCMLDRIFSAAYEQVRLVDQVLDLGRLESGSMPVKWQALSLPSLLQEMRGRKRPPPAGGVQLDWTVPADLGRIETDPEKLGVVLDNLIDNALKFTPAGRVAVGARRLCEGGQVEFTVEDTGPGIKADDLPTIFEMFRQVDGSPSRRYGGVGLGLAIVDRYVRLLQGTIEVHSEIGHGTRFVVRLPVRPPPPGPAVAPISATSAPTFRACEPTPDFGLPEAG